MWETHAIREDGHVTWRGSSVGSGCAGFMELAGTGSPLWRGLMSEATTSQDQPDLIAAYRKPDQESVGDE